MNTGSGSRASRGVWSKARLPVPRLQRYPQYTDDELVPWFNEVAKGYAFEQAASRAMMVWQAVENTIYGDDDVFAHALRLSMLAGAKIRSGEQAAPRRADGLYDEFLTES